LRAQFSIKDHDDFLFDKRSVSTSTLITLVLQLLCTILLLEQYISITRETNTRNASSWSLSQVKFYEKEAARIREKAAKAKVLEAEEKHRERSNNASISVIKEKKRKKKKPKSEDNPEMEVESGSDYESEDDVLDNSSTNKEDVNEELNLISEAEAKAAEEEERAMHLGDDNNMDIDGPSLLKKRKNFEDRKAATSLISNLGTATPPNEFSKSLGMKHGGKGTILFPNTHDAGNVESWAPPSTASQSTDGDLVLELPDFDASQVQMGMGNNTIGIKCVVPSTSKRFSFNIVGPNHRDYFDILFHFNPRQHEKGGRLILNDKREGIWGHGVAIPLASLPLIFSQNACTILIQINGEGFDVFLDKKHCARLEHRTGLPIGKTSLFLQFPSTDDYGNVEEWTLNRIWWGHKELMATNDISNIPGVNTFSKLHPMKLFVSGLDRLTTEVETELRRAELERAFRKFGGSEGAKIIAPLNSTFAFVELDSERQADLALAEMQHSYRLNRARMTRHEALKEKKEAASNHTAVEESNEWD